MAWEVPRDLWGALFLCLKHVPPLWNGVHNKEEDDKAEEGGNKHTSRCVLFSTLSVLHS